MLFIQNPKGRRTLFTSNNNLVRAGLADILRFRLISRWHQATTMAWRPLQRSRLSLSVNNILLDYSQYWFDGFPLNAVSRPRQPRRWSVWCQLMFDIISPLNQLTKPLADLHSGLHGIFLRDFLPFCHEAHCIRWFMPTVSHRCTSSEPDSWVSPAAWKP